MVLNDQRCDSNISMVIFEGALLWARCRMRVDQLAQERASTRLGLVVAALRDAANEEPVDEFPSPPGAGDGGASAAT